MELLLSAIQQSVIFLPLALGIYLSYRILAVTDLTVDGTFVLGAVVFARLVTNGANQYLSSIIAIMAGAFVGMLVALMQKIARINSLLASILAVFMLYSVNFKILGKPNCSLLDSNLFLAKLQNTNEHLLLVVSGFIVIVLLGLIYYLLNGRLGLLLRAYGSNLKLLNTIGKSSVLLLIIGLSISNAFAAFCGVLTAQINGYADLNMGVGMALTAIGAVVIGQHLVGKICSSKIKFNALIDSLSCMLGTFIYFLAMNVFLQIGVDPIYLKLLLGLMLVCFLAAANYSKEGLCYEQ